MDIGKHCSSPYECDFRGRCWPELPANHVSQLYRIGKGAAALEKAGYETIGQIPEGHKLSPINQRLRRSVLAGGAVGERELRDALDEIEGAGPTSTSKQLCQHCRPGRAAGPTSRFLCSSAFTNVFLLKCSDLLGGRIPGGSPETPERALLCNR